MMRRLCFAFPSFVWSDVSFSLPFPFPSPSPPHEQPARKQKIPEQTHLSPPPPPFRLSTPLNPATPTSTTTTAFPPSFPPSLSLAAPPPRTSAGPATTHTIFVLPISKYELPSAEEEAAWVDIWAERRRSSFQRRPSSRRCECERW